jgi:uncharacterized protein (TIGR02757 family)
MLRERLDELVATFDVSTISPDPLELARRYDDPLDQEVAGLIAAAFAYGRAEIIVANVGAVLEKMGASPFAYVKRLAVSGWRLGEFTHRFHKTADLVAFLECLSAAIAKHGSLGELFRKCYDDNDSDIGPSLTRFIDELRSPNRQPLTAKRSSLQYLLTSPRDGSACKRMLLFLRWMVRRTPPDLGLWTFVDPAKLVMPVDTHIHRIATFLGLNRRKSADWKTARALTARLAKFDAADPIRYDFALCRLGILDLCSRKRRKENCDVCLLRDVCRFPVV